MGRDTWHWGVRYWVNKEEWGKSGMLGSIPEGSRGVMDLEGVQGLATGGVNGERSAVGGETVKEGVEGGKKAMGKTTLPGVGNTEKKQRGGGVYSTKVRTWEKGIENIYAQKLRNEVSRLSLLLWIIKSVHLARSWCVSDSCTWGRLYNSTKHSKWKRKRSDRV